MVKHAEILVIDDNFQDTLLLKKILSEYDPKLHLDIVQNYVDAVNFLFLNSDEEILSKLQLILLEISISDNKGRILLHQIKENPELKKIPLLVLTRSPDPTEAEYCYNEFVNAYLHKPESTEEFSHMIKMILKFWMGFVSLPEHAWS